MSFYTYILFSKSKGKYYTGSTSDIKKRISYHNNSNKGFTSHASDWCLVYLAKFETVQEARIQEKNIKKRGAFRFLNDNST